MSFPSQVTSRGCARAFILCVLWRGWEYVRNLKANGDSVCFPFPESVVQEWIDASIQDCSMAKEFVTMFGGTDFNEDDQSSYWTQPAHFFTWWKNNVERKSKFSSLARDAISKDDIIYDRLRTFYCQQAVAISANIRNHFDRIITHQRDFNIYQVTCPIDMPEHMKLNEVSPVFIKRNMNIIETQPLTYVYQTLDTFIVQKFPSLKRFLKGRSRQGGIGDASHTAVLEAVKNNLSTPTHAPSKQTLAKRSCFSAFVRREKYSQQKAHTFLTGCKLLSDDEENEDEEEKEGQYENGLINNYGMCLRPRAPKRPRSCAYSSVSEDDSEESFKGRHKRFQQSSDDDDENVDAREDDGHSEEYEQDEEDDEDDFDNFSHGGKQKQKKRKNGKSLSSSPRKGQRPQNSVNNRKNMTGRPRFTAKKAGNVSTPYAAGAQESTNSSPKAAKPRRLKLPKSSPSKAVSSPSQTSKSLTWEYDYSLSHAFSSGTHHEECEVLPRPLDLDDFQLFNSQDMLGDAVLSPVTLDFPEEENADVHVDNVSMVGVKVDTNAVTSEDLLSLHPLPWQLHASLMDSSSNQLLTFFDRSVGKFYEEPRYKPSGNVISIARFLETPETVSSWRSPSEDLDSGYPGVNGSSPAMTTVKKTVTVSCTSNDHLMIVNQQMESFLSISFDDL